MFNSTMCQIDMCNLKVVLETRKNYYPNLWFYGACLLFWFTLTAPINQIDEVAVSPILDPVSCHWHLNSLLKHDWSTLLELQTETTV